MAIGVKFHQISNFACYQKLIVDHRIELEKLQQYQMALSHQLQLQGAYCCERISWPIQGVCEFLIDNRYSEAGEINWCERLVCQKTQLNNRIRGAIHVFEQAFESAQHDSIYLTEQHTVLYKWFSKNYANISGSEYLTDSSWLNRLKFSLRLFPDALVHQDLIQLTYPNDSFNYALSFDCFEHIADYKTALAELYRVIKKGGKLLFSVPFDRNSVKTLIRATVDEGGSITHHVEPEYHGNPVSKQGSLSFYTFGWDLLERLQDVGFKQAYAIVYWSKQYAYLGGPQMLLCAEK